MRERVNLTLDPGLTLRAKQLAKARGISLSRLIEDLLRDICETEAKGNRLHRRAFSRRWRGKVSLVEGVEPRRQYLQEKYLNDWKE